MLYIGDFDALKEEVRRPSDQFGANGGAVLALDAAGTGQAPIRPEGDAERLYTRALDYLRTRPELDARRVAVWGEGWGGYWAAKLAFMERERLRGVVAVGAPVHLYFQPEWQQASLDTPDFLFDLFPARATMYGVETREEYLAYGPWLSLLDQGFIVQPSTPMLLINGEADTLVPINDLYLLLRNGSAKEAWINPQGGHKGRSADWPEETIFERVALPWIVSILDAAGGR